MAINELAWEPNSHRKGELKSNLGYLMGDLIDEFYEKQKAPEQVAAGSGYSIFFSKDGANDSVFLLSTPDSVFPVGAITLDLQKGKAFVDTTVVMPKWQGKGLGLKLYQAALSHYGSLRSSTSLSPGSQKVWEVLCKKYKGMLAVSGDFFDNNKEVLVKIVGFTDGRKGGRTPLVKDLDGNTKSLEDLLKSRGKNPRSFNAASSSYYVIFK